MSGRLRRLAAAAAVLAGVIGILGFINWSLCERPLAQVIASSPKYAGIVAYAHYGAFVSPRTLVFDVRDIGPATKRLDVFRVFLEFAETQAANDFDSIKLQFRGETRFAIKGKYFQALGLDARDQNPIWVVRMFPHNTQRADGAQAFPTREGGDFPTIAMQLQDFNDLHDQWYRHSLEQ
jgi:hypothetical protein